MEYLNLKPAIDAYEHGENVTQKLRELAGTTTNTPDIIEIAYDLQSGSYIDMVARNQGVWQAYVDELSNILKRYVVPGDKILDVGTGELTTLAGVAPKCFTSAAALYACDISWSRIYKGRSFFQSRVDAVLASRTLPFVANLFELPLGDGAVDLVWTSHALEPNGGREREALSELFRVARRKLVLYEPSYENNSPEGRKRMDSHGYIKGLPEAIAELGGHLEECYPVPNTINPLNPTHAYIVSPPEKPTGAGFFVCPGTSMPLAQQEDCYWSDQSFLAFPILKGIPVLRRDAAILASGLG